MESLEAFDWYLDTEAPAARTMYGILWHALSELVSEEAMIDDVTVNNKRTVETHPAEFLKTGDVVNILIYHSPEGYPDGWFDNSR